MTNSSQRRSLRTRHYVVSGDAALLGLKHHHEIRSVLPSGFSNCYPDNV